VKLDEASGVGTINLFDGLSRPSTRSRTRYSGDAGGPDQMRMLLNLLWIVLGGGFLIWLEYVIGGLLLCLTIVGIPFGVQCFKMAGMGLLPFGKQIQDDPTSASAGCLGVAMNVLWFLVAGLWICLSHLALALASAATIVGIPFAVQHVKLAVLALAPFGKRVSLL
jgi:uncharacterized membrane protein YccF (DUF307 family)